MPLGLYIKSTPRYNILTLPQQGLVSHLDTRTATQFVDSVGTSDRPVQPGRGYKFDGVDDYLKLAVNANDFTDEATMVVKLRRTLDDTKNGCWNLSSASLKSHYYYTNGYIYDNTFRNVRVDYITPDPALDRTQPHYVIITTKPGIDGWKMRQNETVIATADGLSAIYFNTSNSFLGRNNSAADHYTDSTFYLFALYNRELTDQEISDIVQNDVLPTSGLKVLHKFDEGAGTIAYDSSGNGNHGTMYNITQSTFHVTDNRIRSWQNEVGYSKRGYFTDGIVRIDGIPSFTNCTVEFTVFGVTAGSKAVPVTSNVISRYFGVWESGSTSQSIGTNVGTLYEVYVDGVLLNPKTRGELHDRISDGNAHVIKLTKLDDLGATDWRTFRINGYQSGWEANCYIYDFKIDVDGDGTWDHHWKLYGEDALKDQIGELDATIESGNPFLYIPAVNDTTDALGFTLIDSGRVKYNANLVQSNCATFDGVDDYAKSDKTPSQQIFWLSFRIIGNWPSNYRGSLWGFKNSNSPYKAVHLYYWGNSSGKNFGLNTWNNDSYGITNADAFMEDGNPHHIVARFDAQNPTAFRLFVDGVEQSVSQTSGTSNAITLDTTFTFGNYPPSIGSSHYPACSQFDVKLYEGDLATAEINELLQTGEILNKTPDVFYPCAEGAGEVLYDISGNGYHATLYNISAASFWANTQDVFHYNIDRGFSLYTHATNNDLRVPYDLNGQPLSITPPSGYTLASEHPAGNWHNGAETKIQMPAGDANLAAGTFWMDSAGTLQVRGYNDIVDIWNNENITFADVSVANKKKNITTYDSAQSGQALTAIKKYLNIP